ncbi:MAG: tyrosine decarboxylase MfnA [Euryarchaeota archaeon]|nr:tyrosine decarboxylase MfnA [Euryarchaeota archaeon]
MADLPPWPAPRVEARLRRAKRRDTPYGRILGSMCTPPHPIARRAHGMFLETNLGDHTLFPGCRSIEEELIGMLGALAHHPHAAGYHTSGGTESNVQALRILRNLHRRTAHPNIVAPRSAHFSFEKAADLLRIEFRRAPLGADQRADPAAMERLMDRNTVGLVAVAGTTEFGQVDPIPEIGALARDHHVGLHVDGAFGALVIPFLPRPPRFDFRVPEVATLSIDPHKMGMATIPSGVLLARTQKLLDTLTVQTRYLPTKEQVTLAGTRSGAAAAATYAVLRHLGTSGMKRVVARCMENTRYLARRLTELGTPPLLEPPMNLVAFQVPNVEGAMRLLARRGWRVSRTHRPPALRIVVMPHVTRMALDRFLQDYQKVLRQL